MKNIIEPRLLRMNDLVGYCKFSRAHIYQLIKDGSFPGGCMISAGIRVWEKVEIDEYLDQQMGKNA
jgi:predicted DNA-binding transcriptional regulator AlpA